MGRGGEEGNRVKRNRSPRKLDRTEKLDGLFGTLTSSERVRITNGLVRTQHGGGLQDAFSRT